VTTARPALSRLDALAVNSGYDNSARRDDYDDHAATYTGARS
jgi:hypothetical protein